MPDALELDLDWDVHEQTTSEYDVTSEYDPETLRALIDQALREDA